MDGNKFEKVKLSILGCGDRGNVYASYSKAYPDEAEVVAVIDIDPIALNVTGDKYGIPAERRFLSLDDFLAAKIGCDAVVNATMDPAHYETAKKVIEAGYDQLLEKPVVNNEKQLSELVALAEKKGVRVLVCHVLRYTPYYRSIKKILMSGRIGKIISLEMDEHVEIAHFTDSFVRGKWSDERVCGSSLLLQKCSHDLDLMCWLNNSASPVSVFSAGSRSLFVPENAPEGATEFCYMCPHNKTCLYDAHTIHIDCDWFPNQTWREIGKPLSEVTPEDKEKYLRESDYGRCVYTLDRQLVDRQMTTVTFDDGSVGSFAVVGGCSCGERNIHIVGTKGEILGSLETNEFVIRERNREKAKKAIYETVDVTKDVSGGGHSNGDTCLMHDFVRFLRGATDSISITRLSDSVNGHKCIYAAEESRKANKAITIR